VAEKRTRRRFAAAFKAQAIKRLLEGGRGGTVNLGAAWLAEANRVA
jgi:transposase-like protein